MTISRCRRLLSVAALGVVLIWPSASQSATKMFELPAQPLSKALAAFSKQTGISILVTSDLIKNKTAAPVHGRLTPQAALQQLLEPTDLKIRRVDQSAWTLLPRYRHSAPSAPPPPDGTVTRAYAGAVQRHLSHLLCREHPDQLGRFRLAMQLWIAPDGRIEKVHVLDSQASPRQGATVRDVLEGSRMAAPPAGQPSPVTVLLRATDGSSPCDENGGL